MSALSGLVRYCEEHDLKNHLVTCVDLIRENFPTLRRIEIYGDADPEFEGEDWIVMEAEVRGSVKEVLRDYDNYTGAVVRAIPWPHRQRLVFSYFILPET